MPIRFPIAKVNHYLFQKQHLTAETRSKSIPSLTRDVGPIGAARPTVPYISLWARMKDFRREDLDDALYEERSLLRVPCMRGQLYLVPTEDYPAYYQVTKPFFQRGLEDLGHFFSRAGEECEINYDLCDETLIQRVLEVVSSQGPHTIAELTELLPILGTRVYHDPEYPDLGYSKLGTQLIPAMCAQGILVRTKPRGGWRSQVYMYEALSSWVPELDMEAFSAQEALQHVVGVYVKAFGPVTVGDISLWLGGYARRQVMAALMDVGDALTRVQIANSPGVYFVYKEAVEALRSHTFEEHSVALLPPHDMYPMAYSDTSRFLSRRHRDHVFDRVGEPLGTVWLDGYIVGIWNSQPRDEHILVRLFEPLPPNVVALVGEETRRLSRFLDYASFDVEMEGSDEQRLPEMEKALA
ncbi:MAG: winged helix DNA-binding domain-containing protein [Chloroflexota bacterium]|nr:winged helix DNA-binding domain-containing protein [Chloroflexota bacterium]